MAKCLDDCTSNCSWSLYVQDNLLKDGPTAERAGRDIPTVSYSPHLPISQGSCVLSVTNLLSPLPMVLWPCPDDSYGPADPSASIFSSQSMNPMPDHNQIVGSPILGPFSLTSKPSQYPSSTQLPPQSPWQPPIDQLDSMFSPSSPTSLLCSFIVTK